MHTWTSQVRDYEVDFYGGVNAATYLNYMEEARKHYLAEIGIDVIAFFRRGTGFVVGRYEINYLRSLVSGDVFVVETVMERVSEVKVEFAQQILREIDKQVCVKCKNTGVAVSTMTNKVHWPEELDQILIDFPIRKRTS
jgi:YbgC/YbaW family acyl-CoA thioester hydrolase